MRGVDGLDGVGEVMRRRWISVAPHTAVRDALQIMRMGRLRQLPVVADGILHGVLSYSALVDAVLTRRGERVVDVMSPESETGEAGMPIREAAARIARSPAGCLAVVEPGPKGPRLVGLLTEADLLQLAYDRSPASGAP